MTIATPVPKSRRRTVITLGVIGFLFALSVTPVWGSMFGEENTTLIHMLVQLLQIERDMSELNQVAGEVASATGDLVRTYQRVNAGIDQIKNYSFDAFARDLRIDLYHQYPGFGQLEYASRNLGQWGNTFSSSPFTAYQAITAVVGDASQPLRNDIRAHQKNIDQELILLGEASGGFAAAYTAEQATQKFDDHVSDLGPLARTATPAQAAQISARAELMLVAQQSHIMRLLARTVRLHSVDASIEYAKRIQARNYAYEHRDETAAFARLALAPPALMNFSSDWESSAPDPYLAPGQPVDSSSAVPTSPTDPYGKLP